MIPCVSPLGEISQFPTALVFKARHSGSSSLCCWFAGPSGLGTWAGAWTPCSRFVGSLLIVGRQVGPGAFGETGFCLFYPSSCGPFITYCEGTIQLVCKSLSEGIFPYVVADSVCPWEEVSSGSSYGAISEACHFNHYTIELTI